MNNIYKSNNNFILDLKSFNIAKNTFHDSINLINDKK